MKITLIGPVYPFRGGIAHYTALFEQSLRQAGHDVQLISFRRQYPAWLYRGKSDRDPSLEPVLTTNADYLLDPLNPSSWLQTFWSIRSFGADLCVLQWWTTFWAPVWFAIALFLRLFSQTKICFLCHNVLPHEQHWWDRWVAFAVLQFGSFWIVQSAAQQAMLHSVIAKEPIAIAPHPEYSMYCETQLERTAAKEMLGITPNTVVLLFFGMIRPYKGLEIALNALPLVIEENENIKLVIAGEFWESKSFYLEMIERLDLHEYIQIDDRYIPDEDVTLYFSAADLLVAPYQHVTGSGVMRIADSFKLPIATWHNQEHTDAIDRNANDINIGEDAKVQYLADSILEKMNKDGQIDLGTESAHLGSWQHLVKIIETYG